MARPVIALLTDFGLRDHYVGVMKGVLLGLCPDASLVDITHDIPAHDVIAAALQLALSYSYFPAATVFLVVVDPGVGTARRGIALEIDGYRFVGPDNGVFTGVLERATEPPVLVALAELGMSSDRPDARPRVGRTFEGRDRFAPIAARLALGARLRELGSPIDDIDRLGLSRPTATAAGLDGTVVHVDRFGNLITNVDRRTFDAAAGGRAVSIDVGGERVSGIVETYGEVASGALCALFGSADRLEIAVRDGSAAVQLQTGRGAGVRVNIHRL